MKKATLILLLLLSGCISPEKLQAIRDQHEIEECTNLGFKPNTKDFAQCRLQIRSVASQENQASAVRYNAIMSNYNATRPRTCTGYGSSVTCY